MSYGVAKYIKNLSFDGCGRWHCFGSIKKCPNCGTDVKIIYWIEVATMTKDYSVKGTTKLQREKYLNDALALSTLDAPAPTEETMALLRDYVDGTREIDEVLKLTIERYKVIGAHA